MEQLVVDAVVNELDPEARVEAYLKLAERYLLDAEELYAKGDLVPGEKYWGMVTALLSAIVERRGMPHYTHRDSGTSQSAGRREWKPRVFYAV